MKALFIAILLVLLLGINSKTTFSLSNEDAEESVKTTQPSIVLTLEKAIERTLLYNRNLHNAALGVQDSQLNLAVANADFDVKISPLSSLGYTSDEAETTLWQVGGNISQKHSTGISLDIQPNTQYTGNNFISGLGVSLNMPLLRGLGEQPTLDNIYSSEFSLAASKRSYFTRKVDAVIDTVSQVYNLHRDQELENLYREQVALLKHHLLTSRIKEKTGLISIMDVYRAELRIKDVEENISSANERVKDTANRLKDILAIPMEQNIQILAPMDYTLIKIDLNDAIAIALENRVEIVQAAADVQEAKRKEMLAGHNTLPQLNLITKYKRLGSSENFDDSFSLEEDFFSVELSSNTDFARTSEKAAWSRSQLTLKRKQLDYKTTIENISREVRTVLNSLEKTAERIALRKDQVNKASGKRELAHVKFKYGEANNFDLIEAQTQLQEAEVNFISEKIKYIIETYRLRAKLGTLLAYKQ